MKVSLVVAVSICLCLPSCHGDTPVPSSSDDFSPSSPFSMLRKAVFGTRQAEERFISRMAGATQRLAAIVSSPTVTKALRRYYFSLLRSPDFQGLMNSIDGNGGKQSNSTTTTTPGGTSAPTRLTAGRTGVAKKTNVTYKYYFDPELITFPGRSNAESTVVPTFDGHEYEPSHGSKMASKERSADRRGHEEDHGQLVLKHEPRRSRRTLHIRHVSSYMDAIRWDDVDDCIAFLVCEMSRVPWRYGSFGVKVERFFRYPVWDSGSSASHYATMARHGRRLGGCRGRITSCRRPLGPMVQQGNVAVHRR